MGHAGFRQTSHMVKFATSFYLTGWMNSKVRAPHHFPSLITASLTTGQHPLIYKIINGFTLLDSENVRNTHICTHKVLPGFSNT